MFCFQIDFLKVQTELAMADGLHPQVAGHHPEERVHEDHSARGL